MFKALANNNVKLDIVAGTSVGGINAAIIAGSTDDKHPEKALEQFWLEIAENSKALDYFTSFSLGSTYLPSIMHWLASVENFSLSPLYDKGSLLLARNNNDPLSYNGESEKLSTEANQCIIDGRYVEPKEKEVK